MTTGQIIFMAALAALALWFLIPRQRDRKPGWQARKVLMDRFTNDPTVTPEHRDLLLKASFLSYDYPDLSPGELIRLVYWGGSGPVDECWRKFIGATNNGR